MIIYKALKWYIIKNKVCLNLMINTIYNTFIVSLNTLHITFMT